MFSVFFFFKQKTAYEMRISDWSSDVCSSDLAVDLFVPARRSGGVPAPARPVPRARPARQASLATGLPRGFLPLDRGGAAVCRRRLDRKSVVSGKSVSVRVDLGGRRIIKKKKRTKK